MATIRLFRATLVAFAALTFVACDESESTSPTPNPTADAGYVDTGSDLGADVTSNPDATATPDTPSFPSWYTHEVCEDECLDEQYESGEPLTCIPPEEFDRFLSGDNDPLKADDGINRSVYMIGSFDPQLPCFNPCEGYEYIAEVRWSCADGTIDDVEFTFVAWAATCYLNDTRQDHDYGFEFDFEHEELTLLNNSTWGVETYCYPQ